MIKCRYCGRDAEKTNGLAIYKNRKDLASSIFYLCKSCDAYVGSHKNSGKPMGDLADKRLRTLRMTAHRHFDKTWKCGAMNRTNAYKWLAEKMGIEKSKCHIGKFDTKECELAIKICMEVS